MSLTLVIPTYTVDVELEDTTCRAISSYKKYVDEIIVSEDGGLYSEKIMSLCDKYLYNKKNEGFTKNVNRGWALSSGDYTAIVNSDTRLLHGDLSDLCLPGKVTSPEIVNQVIDLMAGPFFVVPKTIKEERGMLIEDMKLYCSDSEYEQRIKDIFVRVPAVEVWHDQSHTIKNAKINQSKEIKRDREAYEKIKSRFGK